MNLNYSLSLLGFVIACIIVYYLRKRYLTRKHLRAFLLDEIDESFDSTTKNIVLNISKSKFLYKELIKQVHPDRFQDNKKEYATELSMKITKAKRNYKELLKLKEEVDVFINS